jgi:hypothetical protein
MTAEAVQLVGRMDSAGARGHSATEWEVVVAARCIGGAAVVVVVLEVQHMDFAQGVIYMCFAVMVMEEMERRGSGRNSTDLVPGEPEVIVSLLAVLILPVLRSEAHYLPRVPSADWALCFLM